MSFGLSFSNNSDVVVLDSEFARLCVIYSGRYAPNTNGGYGSQVIFPAPITTSEPPLIFLRPDTVGGLLKMGTGAAPIGSPGNWTGFNTGAYDQVGYQPNGRYFVAIFGAQAVAGYGMRLFDATGKIIFDSGTTSALFTRAFQNWTYVRSSQGPQGDWFNYYTVPFSFPEDEYLLANSFNMRMLTNDNVGRGLFTWWDFPNQTLYAVTNAFSNPFAFFLPAMFAKINS